jgi:hypothetical protein
MSFLKEDLQRYSGDTNARAFASHVRRYRAFVDAEQPGKHSEADWLNKIALHLDGSAAEYLENTTRASSDGRPFDTVEGLLQQLVDIYNPKGSEVDPRDALDRCRQHGPVQQYIKDFMGITLRIPDLGSADAIHRFLAGLKPALATEVRLHHPGNLVEAIHLAADADTTVYARERARLAGSARASHPPYPYSSSSSGPTGHFSGPLHSPQNHPTPMEIGSAAAAGGGSIRPRCALCKREGHIWQQCRRKMDYTCSLCGGRGHPGTYCRNRPNGRGR